MSRCPFEDYKPENEWFCQIYALCVGHVESPCPYPQLFENQWTFFADMEFVKPYIPNPVAPEEVAPQACATLGFAALSR